MTWSRHHRNSWGWFDLSKYLSGGVLGAVANREVIVTDYADLQTEINDMSTLGGGIVRLDGLLVMDASLTMKSNVLLMGYGSGTGLVNNTANNYTIDFQGTAPTFYEIAAPAINGTSITCDTIAEASNFSTSDWIFIRDDTTGRRLSEWFQASADGIPGTGVVSFHGNFNQGMNAASQAAPVTGAIQNSGLMLMDVQKTSTGTLTIDLDYTINCEFDSVTFDECVFDFATSARLIVNNCKFTVSDDTTSHAHHVTWGSHTDKIKFIDCLFENSTYGFYSLNNSYIQNLSIKGCRFIKMTTAFYWFPSSTNGHMKFLEISGCYGYLTTTTTDFLSIGGNCQIANVLFVNNYIIRGRGLRVASIGGSVQNFTITGNNIVGQTANIERASYFEISANYMIGANFTKGASNVTISGNTGNAAVSFNDSATVAITNCVISGNRLFNLFVYSDATRVAKEIMVTGNYFASACSFTEDATDILITGNNFASNLTIGGGAGDVNDRVVICNNNVDGNITFNEAAQDYCTIVGNTYNGTLTTLTGTGNQVANNANY